MSLRKRSSRRGAAFTEALILIPVLILLDVSLMYMMSVYQTKLFTMRQVRTDAWSRANVGCVSPPVSTPDTTFTAVYPDTTIGKLRGDVARAQQEATQPYLRRELNELSLTQVEATTHRRANDQHYFTAFEYKTRNIVMCNEVPIEVAGEYEGEVSDFYGKYVK